MGATTRMPLRAARVFMSTMAILASPQKITFAEMRESGARGLLVYCADYRCSIAVSADRWPEVQLSDIEPRFTCTSRGNLRRTGCTVPPFTSIAEHRERRIAYESIPGLLAHRGLLHRQSPRSLTDRPLRRGFCGIAYDQRGQSREIRARQGGQQQRCPWRAV
jgi:hypothetical protein